MGDCDCGGADMAVELEAGLNADSDPSSEYVTQGERKWTCKCCGRNFTGLEHKITKHIAGKKFLYDRDMDITP